MYKVLYDKTIELSPDNEIYIPFENLQAGDIVTISCATTDGSYCYFGFYSREDYFKRRKIVFDFQKGSGKPLVDLTKPTFTKREKITESDDWYLVVRRSMWASGPSKVEIKVKKNRGE